jgi:hypothetical protein
MKITLVVLFMFLAAAAFGQASGVGYWGQQAPSYSPMIIPDHPSHASQHDMGIEQSLVGGGNNTYTYAQGERPLWEFGPVVEEPSLGDVARAYRKQKMTAKKAEIIYEKQGS